MSLSITTSLHSSAGIPLTSKRRQKRVRGISANGYCLVDEFPSSTSGRTSLTALPYLALCLYGLNLCTSDRPEGQNQPVQKNLSNPLFPLLLLVCASFPCASHCKVLLLIVCSVFSKCAGYLLPPCSCNNYCSWLYTLRS